MNAIKWIRQSHRWISIAFVLTVIIDSVAAWQQTTEMWLFYLPLLPLALLMLTGLYMFVLPYLFCPHSVSAGREQGAGLVDRGTGLPPDPSAVQRQPADC